MRPGYFSTLHFWRMFFFSTEIQLMRLVFFDTLSLENTINTILNILINAHVNTCISKFELSELFYSYNILNSKRNVNINNFYNLWISNIFLRMLIYMWIKRYVMEILWQRLPDLSIYGGPVMTY